MKPIHALILAAWLVWVPTVGLAGDVGEGCNSEAAGEDEVLCEAEEGLEEEFGGEQELIRELQEEGGGEEGAVELPGEGPFDEGEGTSPVIPEPTAAVLMGVGLVTVGLALRRRR